MEGLRWALNKPRATDNTNSGQDGENEIGVKHNEPSITQSIVKSLSSEPNLYHVRQWKKFTADLQKKDKQLENSRVQDYQNQE